MVNEDIEMLRNRIWFTAKSRMMAERRYKGYDGVFTILIATLSVLAIGMNLLALAHENSINASFYSTFIAVFILMISLIVYGFQFGQKATLHRECYLRLQKINSEIRELDALNSAYNEILGAYPNHSNRDYETFVVGETLFKKKSLIDSKGLPVKWTWSMLGGQLAHVVALWGLPALLIIVFVVPFFWLLK